MSQEYCILNLLNIEDKNINLTQNFYKIEKFGDIYYKVIEAKLTYKPEFYPRCGYVFNKEQTYEKNVFITSDTLMLDVCNHGCILRLHKQRFLCHCCNKKFIAKTKIVNDGCFISNQVKYAIALELKKKSLKWILHIDLEFHQILWKELLTLIMKVRSYIKIIYPRFYLLMNLNQLNQLMGL